MWATAGLQRFVKIKQGSPVFNLTPGQYTEAWNGAKKEHAENKSGNPLIPTFLLNVLYATPKDPTNNILTCAAAVLLELSCRIDDFCQHVRRTGIKKYGSCLITNNETELALLSGDFIDEKCDEIGRIKRWAGGKLERTGVTLSIGGESGCGKTRAALQCAQFRRESKKPEEQSALSDDQFLIVYLKVNGESNKHWNNAVADKHEDAMKTMERLWNEGCRGSYDTYKTTEFLEVCMQEVPEEDKHALRSLRAALCHHWICGRIAEITQFDLSLESKNPFEIAFIVLDEVAACPWLYKAVNRVSTDTQYVPNYFSGSTSFAGEYRFICVSTASESILRDMRSTPGAFEPVTMKPSPMLYAELVTKTFAISPVSVFKILIRNNFFAKLVLNRRCAVMAVEVMKLLTLTVQPVVNASGAMNSSDLNRTNHGLFSITDAEGAYALAGFLVCLVSAQYKAVNGASTLDADEAKEIVAKGIRAVLCCEDEKLGDVFSGFPTNPFRIGLFDSTFSSLGNGEQRVRISLSVAQQVMGATAYGSGALFTTNTTGGAFEVFSAAVFSLYLSGYSTKSSTGDGKAIKVTTGADLSTFIKSVSATKFTSSYKNLLEHPNVSGILFALQWIAIIGSLESYLGVLSKYHGGKDKPAFVLVNGRNAPYADLIAKSGDILFIIQCKSSVKNPTFNVNEELRKMGFSDGAEETVDSLVNTLFPEGTPDTDNFKMARDMLNFKKNNLRKQLKKCTAKIVANNIERGFVASEEKRKEAVSGASVEETDNVPTAQDGSGAATGQQNTVETATPEVGANPSEQSNVENDSGEAASETTADADTTDQTTTPDPDVDLLKGKLLTSLLMWSLGCTIAVPVFVCTDPGTDKAKDDLKDLVQGHKVNSFGWNDPAALLFIGGGIERNVDIGSSSPAAQEEWKTGKKKKKIG
ncbi:hypothetical protein AGDE_13955 [Angomonas deanei]|uniref:Uncharacterized protein n=1 Tax=Angomonas deanei TaxID=59799 RepID=A0A7G2CKU0_9TRYP|nr:hypothetical protein AGDE_13955 [Angomonas deanei]CAD2220005.1 hypothetical protein, conserved [Angomonas deanei]|eukprot:EPY21614.1 hypothetical protein AGDE_13955 [Angomonas deanei]